MKMKLNSSIERREAIKLLLGSASALLWCGTGCTRTMPLTRANVFPQSVASGDPLHDSVVLWTRVVDEDWSDEDYLVKLEVAEDNAFSRVVLQKDCLAYAELDHCIRVRIDSLSPNKHYYYRFNYQGISSRVGRTRTTPSSDEDVSVKFAMVYGQDYVGRYYNSYAHMLRHDDLDFVLHIGDYIYETTGDPSFQNVPLMPERKVVFDDKEHVQALQRSSIQFYAANSTDNYRQLYQIYRSDPMLQQIHERFPMISIWDDHEYRDDYAGGAKGEQDDPRRSNARRAYFEYMPIDVGFNDNATITPDDAKLFESDMTPILYRDFTFGKHLHIVLSDYRTFRAESLISSDAFYGAIFADETVVKDWYEHLYPGGGEDFFESQKDILSPYIDIELSSYAIYRSPLRTVLAEMYINEGESHLSAFTRAYHAMHGKLHAELIQAMILAYNEGLSSEATPLPLLYTSKDDPKYQELGRGMSYLNLGKTTLLTRDGLGVSTMVIKEAFDLYASLNDKQDVYGDKQRNWIGSKLSDSNASWQVFVSSVSLAPMKVDLENIDSIDDRLRKHYYVNLDQFDGFPIARERLLAELRTRNSLVLSGDIHALFVADHKGIPEVTGPAISTATAHESIVKKIKYSELPIDKGTLIDTVKSMDFDSMLMACDKKCADNHAQSTLKYTDVERHGYTLLKVGEDAIESTVYLIDSALASQNLYYEDDLNRFFTMKYFVFAAG